MSTRVACLAIACLLTIASGTALAQPSPAEKLFNDGQQAYDAKQYDKAVIAWTQSYDISRLPALLFNLAQAHRLRGQPGDCTKAIDRYRQFIALDPTSAQRTAAEGFLVELGPCATAEANPRPNTNTNLHPIPTATAGDPGRTKRLASYIVGGGGLVLLATGVYFGSEARRLGNEVTEQCANGCMFEDVASKDADGRSAATKQWVFYGLGAAGLATSGVLYYLGSREKSSTVAVTPRGGGAVVTWSGAW